MNVTIYHNPRRSKSRQALELIRAHGIEPTIIEYLNDSLDAMALSSLFSRLEISDLREAMRKKEEPYITEKLSDPDKSNDELIQAISKHPILLERPIVVTEKGARICRPPELVNDILP